jgi:hypothetical protein
LSVEANNSLKVYRYCSRVMLYALPWTEGCEPQGHVICGTYKVNWLKLISHAFLLQISYALFSLYVGVPHQMLSLNMFKLCSSIDRPLELLDVCCFEK